MFPTIRMPLPWPMTDGETQQTTKSWRQRWVRGGSDGLLGDEGRVGPYPIVWAIEVSDEKIMKIKHVAALDSHHTIFYTQQTTKNMWL